MKLVVDYDLCEANAICERLCPEVFRVEDDESLTVFTTEIPPNLHAQVKKIVRLCPRQALQLEG